VTVSLQQYCAGIAGYGEWSQQQAAWHRRPTFSCLRQRSDGVLRRKVLALWSRQNGYGTL